MVDDRKSVDKNGHGRTFMISQQALAKTKMQMPGFMIITELDHSFTSIEKSDVAFIKLRIKH